MNFSNLGFFCVCFFSNWNYKLMSLSLRLNRRRATKVHSIAINHDWVKTRHVVSRTMYKFLNGLLFKRR